MPETDSEADQRPRPWDSPPRTLALRCGEIPTHNNLQNASRGVIFCTRIVTTVPVFVLLGYRRKRKKTDQCTRRCCVAIDWPVLGRH
jgi:hypothetical protein